MKLEKRQLSGLKDKLFWRPEKTRRDRFHCFARNQFGKLVSLCGRHEIDRSDGQACKRPHVYNRCAICDGREADRRGWDGSGDPSPGFEEIA